MQGHAWGYISIGVPHEHRVHNKKVFEPVPLHVHLEGVLLLAVAVLLSCNELLIVVNLLGGREAAQVQKLADRLLGSSLQNGGKHLATAVQLSALLRVLGVALASLRDSLPLAAITDCRGPHSFPCAAGMASECRQTQTVQQNRTDCRGWDIRCGTIRCGTQDRFVWRQYTLNH